MTPALDFPHVRPLYHLVARSQFMQQHGAHGMSLPYTIQ